MRKWFDDIDLRCSLGFGCMRLPMENDNVDLAEFCKMVDLYLDEGFNYFDTAHGYISGKSETAIRDGLTKRHPRSSYVLTDKLSESYFESESDIRPFFESQLVACGVDYFDFYLMHAQNKKNYTKYKECNAYKIAGELKKEGKIRHYGLSFHDKADVLDMILTENPDIEIVQIQFNYVDYEDPAVQSRLCYEVCRKHNKPVIVMEPVKGGSLANLPEEAKKVFDAFDNGSHASYAVRFVAGFDNVISVLSGMSNFEQMKDNIGVMKNYKPLSDKESEAIKKVTEIILSQNMIQCTACRYCVEGCPEKISIPDLFACMNARRIYRDWNSEYYYHDVHTANNGKASDCIKCGKCEKICPQHLPIRDLLKDVADEFENN